MQPWLKSLRLSAKSACEGVEWRYTFWSLGKMNLTSPSAFFGPGFCRTISLPAQLCEHVFTYRCIRYQLARKRYDLIVVFLQVSGVLGDFWNDLSAQDARWYVPIRPEHQVLHLFIQHWSLRPHRPAHHDRHHYLWFRLLVVSAQQKFRYVHDNRRLLKTVRQPAIALQHQLQLLHAVAHGTVQFRNRLRPKFSRRFKAVPLLKILYAIQYLPGIRRRSFRHVHRSGEVSEKLQPTRELRNSLVVLARRNRLLHLR